MVPDFKLIMENMFMGHGPRGLTLAGVGVLLRVGSLPQFHHD